MTVNASDSKLQRTGVGAQAVEYSKPVKNLRITFWGTQGSVPTAPEPEGVDEYIRRVMVFTLSRAAEDLTRQTEQGAKLEDLLSGPLTHDRFAAYQKRLGLPTFPVYGGETTCVSVETSDNQLLIFDGGTGIRRCANEIGRRWNRPHRTVHLFGSHEHLDHRNGLPFCRFVYDRPDPYTIHIYGGRQFLTALDNRYGIFSHHVTEATHYDDPIDYRMMSAQFHGYQICNEGEELCFAPKGPWEIHSVTEPIKVGNTTVTPFDVYHGPTRCLSYKIQHNNKTFVFSTDHEIRRGSDPSDPRQTRSAQAEARLRAACTDVDAAYFDGQYFLSEYRGDKGIGVSVPVSRLDWGHGCLEDILTRSRECRIGRTFIGHLDPERTWPERAAIDEMLADVSRQSPYQIQLANGEESFEL